MIKKKCVYLLFSIIKRHRLFILCVYYMCGKYQSIVIIAHRGTHFINYNILPVIINTCHLIGLQILLLKIYLLQTMMVL